MPLRPRIGPTLEAIIGSLEETDMTRKRRQGTNGKTFNILIVTGLLLPVGALRANIPIPTRAESIQWMRMKEMHWLPALSGEQIAEVRSALGSPYNPAVEEALMNVILHHLDDLVPVTEKGAGAPKSVARDFGEICAEVLNAGPDPLEALRQVLGTRLPGDEVLSQRDKPRHFRIVRHAVTSVLVFEELRAVRAKRKNEPNLRGLELSPFETELVKFSRLDTTAAIDAILEELSKAQVGGTRDYVLIQVLHTYPPNKYIPHVLDKLERAVGTKGYGTRLLLESLKWSFDRLDKAGKAKLRSIIESIRQTDISPSFEYTLSLIESELNRVSNSN